MKTKLFTLFLALAASVGITSATPSASVSSDNPQIWPIVMDDETAEINQNNIVSDFRPNDDDNNLWIWDDTYVGRSASGANFYGNYYEDYVACSVVAPEGWSGMGFNIAKPTSVTAMQNLLNAIKVNPDDYYLHIAIKSTDEASHQFYIFGNDTTSFAIGTQTIEKGQVIGDFPRDGSWSEFYIPMAQLAISDVEVKNGTDILVVLSGNQVGAALNLDAIYFCNKYAKEQNFPETARGDVSHVKIGDLYYDLDGKTGTAEVTSEDIHSNYKGLTTADIPSSVTYYYDYGLPNVGYAFRVTSISESAFFDCGDLTSVTIPGSVTSIGSMPFAACTSLTQINVASDNPNYCSIDGVLFDKQQTALIQYPGGKQGTYVIPNSVTSIAMGAFFTCFDLTAITIPESVTSIERSAFYYCSGLTSITIPDNVTSIGEWAFALCSGITSLIIPASVASIGSAAFAGCPLTSITDLATTPQAIDEDVFIGNEEHPGADKSTCVLYVPEEAIALYKAADVWKDFQHIEVIPVEGEDEVQVVPTETTATISWSKVVGAYTYELVIRDGNGNIVFTLTFDAEGHLISLAFGAPARDNASQAAGFSFTVTGLTSGTTYSYTLQAKDSNGAVLQTETGSFTTLGGDAVDYVTAGKQSTKLLRDGQLFILRDGRTYTVQGQPLQ